MPLIKPSRYLILLLLVVAACQTPSKIPAQTTYQAATGTYGYTETETAEGFYEISLQGNESTPYTVIENYLLYRAAELAQERGRDKFAVIRPQHATVEIDQTEVPTVCHYSPANFSRFVHYPDTAGPSETQPDNVAYRATVLIALDETSPAPGEKIIFRTGPVLENLESCIIHNSD